ncbi:MAG: extracellular solute-binding protein [Bryobacteraceae bacterium]
MNRVVGQALSLRRPLRPPLLVNRRTFLMGVAGLAGCARGRPRLNVYNWSNYVAPDTIANFEAEFGVRVRYAIYESNEEMLAKVLSGNSGWDVVFPTHNRIPPMRQYGLLAPLDHARLPNLPNLEPRFQSPPWDPHLDHCVPYMWGATGIAYNRSVMPTQFDGQRQPAPGGARGHRAEAAAARLSERRISRPVGGWRHPDGALLGDHGAAGYRRRAAAWVRIPGRGISAVRR